MKNTGKAAKAAQGQDKAAKAANNQSNQPKAKAAPKPKAKADKGKEQAQAATLTKAQAKAVQAEWLANTIKAAADMKSEAASLSAAIRNLWEYCQPNADDTAGRAANRRQVASDCKAVSGCDPTAATRKQFTQVWLSIVTKYADAVTAGGVALTLKPTAGMLKAVPYIPTLSGIYTKVIRRWLQRWQPHRAATYLYYTKGKGGILISIKAADAAKAVALYEQRQAAISAAAKEAKQQAAATFDGKKAAEQGK